MYREAGMSKRLIVVALVAASSWLSMSSTLHADDTEIYTAALEAASAAPTIAPNLVIVLDTSSSMRQSPGFFADPREVFGAYDDSITYPGDCDPDMVYYDNAPEANDDPGNPSLFFAALQDASGDPDLDSEGLEQLPTDISCSTNYRFPKAAYVCAYDDLDDGYAHAKMQAYYPLAVQGNGKSVYAPDSTFDGDWNSINSRDRDREAIWRNASTFVVDTTGNPFVDSGAATDTKKVMWRECLEDRGTHGPNAISNEYYPIEDGRFVESSGTYDESGSDGSDGLYYGYTNDSSKSNVVSTTNSSWKDHVMYSGNFLNWYLSAQTRLEIMRGVIRSSMTDLANEGKNVRVAILRFDARLVEDSNGDGDNNDSSDAEIDPSQGGMVIQEAVGLLDVDSGTGLTGLQQIVAALADIEPRSAAGSPMAEASLEGLLYFGGRNVGFGKNSNVMKLVEAPNGYPTDDPYRAALESTPSVSGSRSVGNPNVYDSPIQYTCQSNHMMLLSDGQPSNDSSIKDSTPYTGYDDNYWDYLEYGGDYESEDRCVRDPGADGLYFTADDVTDDKYCLTAIAHYMQNNDILESLPGEQTVKFHTIGFGKQLDPSAQQYLEGTAEIGDGLFRVADSWESMKEAFVILATTVIRENSTFTSPGVSINNLKRTEEENEVYFGVFKTGLSQHWPGNLKKYAYARINNETVLVDADGNPAIASDGYFSDAARSFWSAEIDGNDSEEGGAAHKLPAPASRKLYTVLDGATLPASLTSTEITDGNASITAAMVGATDSDSRSAAIAWLRDDDGASGQDFRMGDPLHSAPVIVTYEKDATTRDQTIYVTTNDGYLHAIDASTGAEIFAFVPPETLVNATALRLDEAGKIYGLDSSVQVLIDEGSVDEPGVNIGTDSDDHVYLFFGMRRGGRNVYALEVTDRSDPKLLWKIKGGDLNSNATRDDATEPYYDLGYTFSEPQIGQLRLGNTRKYILAMGGGYDLKQDDPQGDGLTTTEDAYVADDMGNAIYIVDALTGARLWWAGNTVQADLNLTDMKNSIPSNVKLADMNNNEWSDRIYVGDTGGRLFRFDIQDIYTNSTDSVVATGGMIADFGADGESGTSAVANNRKFFYAPDVVIARDDPNFVAILIGSGNRAHPSFPVLTDTAVDDVFLMLRDPYVFTQPVSYAYGLELDDLYDATDNDLQLPILPANPTTAQQTEYDTALAAYNAALATFSTKEGWYIDLPNEGEKVLAEAITYNYETYFTTFEPLDIDFTTCSTRVGVARTYAVDTLEAKPVNPYFDYDMDGEADDAVGRSHESDHDTISGGVSVNFFEADGGRPALYEPTGKLPGNSLKNTFRTYWYIVE